MSAHLLALMRSHLAVVDKLHEELDKLVPPTTTGYLYAKERWTIAWVREGEYQVDLEIGIDPPRGANSWSVPTIEGLQTLQRQLDCHHIQVRAVESGRVRYIATWNKKGIES